MGRKYGKPLHGEGGRTLWTTRTAEYMAWAGMIQRCTNKKSREYHNYGGRGITVCERWRSYVSFLADVGRRPSELYSLDRFPDVNGNYEPGNVRWATGREQGNNMRKNVRLELNGKTQTMTEWAREFRIDPNTIATRLMRGWTVEAALTRKVRRTVGRSTYAF